MKVLKSNTKEVFDTDNLNAIEIYKVIKPETSNGFHQNHELTDYDFLLQHFPLNHPIFNEFSASFYYIIP
jgi:hypothetical protein